MTHQYELCLPPRNYESDTEQRLRELVVDLNETIDPAERIVMFQEVQRLRAELRGAR